MWTWEYWRERPQKLKTWWDDAKFELAIKSIFIFAVIVSFSHTIELYGSVGFDEPVMWMNRLARVDFITLSLFATLAAEAAFAVGLWGLYEAYEQSRKFPGPKEHWHVWTLFGSGLIVVGWSNIGGAVGYDFIVGQPYKGIALAISIPLFVLGSVLVNFKRKSITDQSAVDQAGTYHSTDQSVINQAIDYPTIDQSKINHAASDQSLIDQSINQTEDQSIINQAADQTDKSIDHPSVDRSINQESIKQAESNQALIDQSSGEQDDQPIKHSIDQSSNQTLNDQSQIDQNEKESIDQSDSDQSITNQSNDQPITQSIKKDKNDQSIKSNVVRLDEEIVDRYPIKEALEYFKEHGKPPTQRGLAKLADTSQHRAMMAVRWLKKQIEQGRVA